MAKQETTETVEHVEFTRVDAGVYAVPLGQLVKDDDGCRGHLVEIVYADYTGFHACGVVVDLSDDVGEPLYRAVRYNNWLGADEDDVSTAYYDSLEDAARATYPDAA